MSHFTVAVLTDESKGDSIADAVAKALAPFHEFECTGYDDEYVQDIDITEEARALYLADTTKYVKLIDGTLVSAWDPSMWRVLTDAENEAAGFGSYLEDGETYVARDKWGTDTHHARTRNHPEGSVEVDVPTPEVKSFVEFVDEYYGYSKKTPYVDPERIKYGFVEVDGAGEVVRVIDRTNPNAEWDWYAVGGRWSGLLRTVSGSGVKGKPGLMGTEFDSTGVDSCMLNDLDLKGMKRRYQEKREEAWDENWPVLQSNLSSVDQEADPEDYQTLIQRADWRWGYKPGDTRESYSSRDTYFSTFAVLYNGEWIERGAMGWWGIVSDEKAPDEWAASFNAILDKARENPHTRITIVDCHI